MPELDGDFADGERFRPLSKVVESATSHGGMRFVDQEVFGDQVHFIVEVIKC